MLTCSGVSVEEAVQALVPLRDGLICHHHGSNGGDASWSYHRVCWLGHGRGLALVDVADDLRTGSAPALGVPEVKAGMAAQAALRLNWWRHVELRRWRVEALCHG